jgi:hypothetical protein
MGSCPRARRLRRDFRRAEHLYLGCSRKRCVLSAGSLLMQEMLAVPRTPTAETAFASCEVLPDGPILSSTTGCSIPGVPSHI